MSRTRAQNYAVAAAITAGAYVAAKSTLAFLRRYDFRDRVIVITGGSRGLGLVLARQLADEGAFLVLCAGMRPNWMMRFKICAAHSVRRSVRVRSHATSRNRRVIPTHSPRNRIR